MAFRFALVGDPVEHSRSPLMHDAAFREVGLEGSYSLIRCDPQGFDEAVEGLRAGVHDGLNVTMPHKKRAFEASDTLTPEASESASVNSLRTLNEDVVGHSSDFVAFRDSYRLLGSPTEIVVIGAGGSARAAIAAFDGPVQVWARKREQVEGLARRFGPRVKPWSRTGETVVVNCTPLGMHGEEVRTDLVNQASAVIDLPYGEHPTPLASASLASGIPLVDGLRFLAMQAAESFRWWTGHQVDPDTMDAAARNG